MTALLHRPAERHLRPRPLRPVRAVLGVVAAVLALAALPLEWHVIAVDATGSRLAERGRDVLGAALLLLAVAGASLTAVRRRPPLWALGFGLASTLAVRLGMGLGDLAQGDRLVSTGPGYVVLSASAAVHALALAVALHEAGEPHRARALAVAVPVLAALGLALRIA